VQGQKLGLLLGSLALASVKLMSRFIHSIYDLYLFTLNMSIKEQFVAVFTVTVGKGKRAFCIAPCHDHTSKVQALRYCSGTRSQEISQFYVHTPRTSVNGMNHIVQSSVKVRVGLAVF